MKTAALRFPWVFAVTGAVQGWILWWLWHALGTGQWPATQPMAMWTILYATLAVPVAIYGTQDVEGLPRRVRWLAVLGYLGVYAGLGAYASWTSGAAGCELQGPPLDVLDACEMQGRPQDMLAACVLGFVSLSLLCGFDFEARRWRYARLFNYSWRNGILLLTAGAMTGAVWLVLFAGAGLMKLITVDWIFKLIQKSIFIYPVTGLVVAGAVALGIARAAMTENIRRFWLSISAWLLPLVLLFGVVWVLVLPFTTLTPLFNTQSAALVLLWFTALAVKFANCAYQDGSGVSPYPAWLGRVTQAAWLSLLPIVAIAWWALGLRVAQYGWSELRLWAALVALLAAIYALGYTLSWRQSGRWMTGIARTNIVAAVVLCLGLLAFLTPLASIQRLAVAAHLHHVKTAGDNTEPDWNYLRWRSGRFGHEALQTMDAGGVANPEWANKAREVLAQTSRYQQSPLVATDAAVVQKLLVYPTGRQLPATFVADIKVTDKLMFNDCVEASQPCDVWLGDLNGDGVDELVLSPAEGYWRRLFVYTQGSWHVKALLSSPPAPANRYTPADLNAASAARRALWDNAQEFYR